jgi:glycosyltransferase involved in cell wall biosynthesis
MDVSVVVPTRNRSALLAMTVRSVLRQKDVTLEVIVVDEASTDDTPAVVSALADDRIRMIRHSKPLGVATARNHGATEARGEWLAFLDDDDLWAADKLAQQLNSAREANRDWVYAGSVNIIDFQIVHGRPPLPPIDVVAALPKYDAVPGGGSNVIVQRTTWLRAGPFDARLRNTEDWEMWIRLSKLGLPAWVCHPLVARRLHRSNSSLDTTEIVRGTRLIEELHHTTADWARLHRWMAQSSLRVGNKRTALVEFAKAAMRGDPVGVASDLIGVIQHRLPRILRRPGRSRTPPDDVWISEAERWLREFEASLPPSERAAATTRGD